MTLQEIFEKEIKELISDEKFESELNTQIIYFSNILAEKCGLTRINNHDTDIEKRDELINLLSKFEKLVSPALKNSFLKGYQVALELLNHEETKLEKEDLVHKAIESRFTEAVESYYSTSLYEFIRTAETQEFILFAIRNFEDVKSCLEQIFTEFAKLGSLYCLKRLKQRRKVEDEAAIPTHVTKLPINHFFNITPSIRAYVIANNPGIEIWSLVWNCAATNNPFVEVGDVVLIHRSKQHIEKDLESGSIYMNNLMNLTNSAEFIEIRVKMTKQSNSPRAIKDVEYNLFLDNLVNLISNQTKLSKENVILWMC
ncbi:hypothetical protein BAMA_04970 [Bacillus manliponensis]|uniref:Uncharacterized protein n=1 Tax=Bacillus manliponensis TaxID=574376 RepID=A0A073JWL3_9BACI|nr:hypothetical protein [Bacillus manliponensis]KEK18602.1 hypothetical protein BAMA_04970 [Bacillus manliponensis]